MTFRDRRRRFVKDLGGKVLWKLENYIARASLIGDHRFFSEDQFPWAGTIEERWVDIRSELEGVLSLRDELPSFQDISKDQVAITNDDLWKTFSCMEWDTRRRRTVNGARSRPNLSSKFQE